MTKEKRVHHPEPPRIRRRSSRAATATATVTRRSYAALAALIFLAAAAHAEVTGWGIVNTGTPYYSGTGSLGWDGNCYGMVRAEVEYMRMGLDRGQPFSAITTPASSRSLSASDAADPVARQISKTSDQIFVEQFAALSQDAATRHRDWNAVYASSPSTPNELASSMTAAKASPENPQILLMRGSTQAHAVIVRGVDEDAEHINYRIRDPNYPGEDRLLRYDKASGSYEGYPEYTTFMHDRSELPAANAAALRALVEGASADGARRNLPIWREGPSNRRPRMEPPAPSGALNRNVSAVNDPEVGGVRLYFDPSIVEVEGGDEDRMKMLWNLNLALASGDSDVVASPGGEMDLTAVSLRSILSDGSTTVGLLTRILGYVMRDGDNDLYILGRIDPDADPIPLDVFTVALREAWKKGHSPAISLDPDPTDFYGPQHVRLEEIDPEDRNTRFVEIMLEADYRMKHVLFHDQEDGDAIEGFRTTYQLLQENPPAEAGSRQARYWLNPRSTAGADVFVEHVDSSTVVYYESDIKVLTEEMMNAMTLASSSHINSIDEEAARLFTDHYAEIAARYPEFRALIGVFDATKLAAVLRRKGVANPLLDEAAARTVEAVPIKASYDGLGPLWIEGTSYFIGGGCRSVETPGDGVAAPLVREIVSSADGTLRVSLTMPGAIPLPERATIDLLDKAGMEEAAKEIAAGRNREAVELLTRLHDRLARSGETILAAAVLPQRAVALLGMGETARALKDVEQIELDLPLVRSLRGLLKVFNGDPEGGCRDVVAAAAADTHDKMIFTNKAEVEMLTLRLDDAEKSLDRLLVTAPGTPEVATMEFQLKVLRRLGPAMARERVRQYLATPFAITLALEEGQSLGLSGRPVEAIARVESALAEMRASAKDLSALHLEERAWILEASLYDMKKQADGGSEEDDAKKDAIIAKLVARRPEWPSAWLVKFGSGSSTATESPRDRLALFRKALALSGESDPMLPEMGIVFGCDPRGYYGIQFLPELFAALGRHQLSAEDCFRITEKVAAFFDSGPERHALKVLGDYAKDLRTIEEIMKRHGASPEKEPDPKTVQAIEREARKVLGDSFESRLSLEALQESLLRMPRPKNGSGLATLAVLGRYYIPVVMDRSNAFISKIYEEDMSEDERRRAGETLREQLRVGMAIFDIEWSSVEAVKRAALGLNSLCALYATSLLAPIDRDAGILAMEEAAKAGRLRPDDYLAAERKAITDAIDRDASATPCLKEFTRALGQTMILDGLTRMKGLIRSAEPSWDDEKAHADWSTLAEEWDRAERDARSGFSIFRQLVEEMPLERPIDVLMAQQLLSTFEKSIGDVAEDPAEASRLLRDLNETRARLDLRLARVMLKR